MIMILAALLALVVYGPTQHGKSTFLKRLGANLSESSLGQEDGRSQTKTPGIYNFNITWPGESTPEQISSIDLPGLDDTEMDISNSAIGHAIGVFTAKMAVHEVSAFLVFCSLGESSTQLKRTLKELLNATGNVTESVIVIMSKADLADKNSKYLKQTVIKDCEKFGVKYVEWSDKVDTEQMRQQLVGLRTAISQVSPYPVHRFQQLEQAVEERALFLREHDPDRYIVRTNDGCRAGDSVRTFTDKQLLDEAKRLQKEGPKDYPKIETVFVVKRVPRLRWSGWHFFKIYEFWTWRDWETVFVDKVVEETRVTYVERPIEWYISMLKGHEKTVILEERYKFEHYLELAREQLVKEMWEKIIDKNKE